MESFFSIKDAAPSLTFYNKRFPWHVLPANSVKFEVTLYFTEQNSAKLSGSAKDSQATDFSEFAFQA